MLFRNSYKESAYYKTIEVTDRDARLLCAVKQHPFGLMVIYAASFIAFVFALSLISIVLPKTMASTNSIYSAWTVLAFICGFVLVVVLIAITYVYNQSGLTVTNKNVIQILQKSIYERKVSHISLANIEDVTSEQRGVFSTMFNFGTLKIETAGEQANFIFPLCPHPNRVARIILDAKDDFIQATGQAGSYRNNINMNT
ncbi:MAG TPA: PH domain-containing protein [Candidatus Saccharibacteria bacterium]|nr:PH domain-containing protein [Candidatus Saccharibacteria bacterium]